MQAKLSGLASSAQEGVASALGSISNAIMPNSGSTDDPEVKDFRSAAAFIALSWQEIVSKLIKPFSIIQNAYGLTTQKTFCVLLGFWIAYNLFSRFGRLQLFLPQASFHTALRIVILLTCKGVLVWSLEYNARVIVYRASAAEAAAEAKAFMQPEAPETLEARSKEADKATANDSKWAKGLVKTRQTIFQQYPRPCKCTSCCIYNTK